MWTIGLHALIWIHALAAGHLLELHEQDGGEDTRDQNQKHQPHVLPRPGVADIANKGLIQGKQQQREPWREGLQEDLTYDLIQDQDTVVLMQGGRSGGSFNEEQLDGIVEELRAKIRRVRRDDPRKARNVVFHLMRYVGRGMKSKLRPLRQASKALADRLEDWKAS